MDINLRKKYVDILSAELVPALGCTEPIAIAYAAAKAREVLGEFPQKIQVDCSGNIIKNVKGVTVPNSKGLKGIDVAAILGVVGGNAQCKLQVLQNIKAEDIEKTKELIKTDFCTCGLIENVENLHICVLATSEKHWVKVTIKNHHTCITEIVKDGEVIFSQEPTIKKENKTLDLSILNVRGIIDFADTVDIKDVKCMLDRQIECNTAISDEGLINSYGAEVGKTLLEVYGDDIKIRAKARAAAGSDARMGGCSLPVIINSGSGNQGMTLSLPVIEYAKELKVTQEKLYRALCVANLISIHQKKYIGSLSAFCGAVTAASGAGAAITYLHGGTYENICLTIVNTLADVSGIVCDGAKPSCAAKIASAVDAAIMGHYMSMKNRKFLPGEGIVQNDIEKTIESMGYIGRIGMKSTDTEILNIMINRSVEKCSN